MKNREPPTQNSKQRHPSSRRHSLHAFSLLRSPFSVSRLFSFLSLTLLAVGCSGPTMYSVSGSVSFDGKPLPAGVIFFDPDVSKSNDGPQGYAIIKNGRYDTAAPGGKGVVGGAYIARIEGFDGSPGEELPLGKPLFTDFQKAIELPKAKSTQNFDIPGKR